MLDIIEYSNPKEYMIYHKMAELFQNNMPDSLYYNYQELSEHLGGTPQQWEHLLDQPKIKQYIESKISKYLEMDAKKALNRLASSNLTSSEITSITKLLENSKLLKQKTETKQQIVVTYMPQKQRGPQEYDL